MNVYDVILSPMITEKVAKQENTGKYTFKVHAKAQKHDIKDAVEKLFNVKVTKVNTLVVPGKWKRLRYRSGLTSEWKKAVVTLKAGQKIELT